MEELSDIKNLPQSSPIIESERSLCMDKFVDPPRTLYDEIGEQEHDAFVTIKVGREREREKYI